MTTDPDDRDMDVHAALSAYRRRLESLRAQARDLSIQISKAEAIVRLMEEETGASHSKIADQQSIPDRASKKPQTNGELVVSSAKRIIKEAKRPLSRQEILDRMLDMGFSLTVANPPKFVGKTLWAHKDFVHVENQGYWLAESPLGAEPADSD